MPLSMVESGRVVRLVAIDSGRRLQARLAALGLVPGTELQVISNSTTGPFVVAVRDSRVVLGRGMAYKILVS